MSKAIPPAVIASEAKQSRTGPSGFFKQVVAFLKKSSAKDFCNFYTGCSNVPRQKINKSFLVLFFKKELLRSFASFTL
jgi:hypothetical protein